MTSALFAMALLSPQANLPALTCPIGGHDINYEINIEYSGLRVGFCCNDCVATFRKDPKPVMEKALKGKALFAYSLFDPVSGRRVRADRARFSSDYQNVRYFFASSANKASFDAEPKKFSAMPGKEALTCPVMKVAVAVPSEAEGYVDFEGTRYYICCGGCFNPFKSDPKRYIGNVTAKTISAHGK